MFFDQTLRLVGQPRFETVIPGEFHGRFNPELCLAIWMLHVHVRPRFLSREEIEPKLADSQDRRAHCERISHATAGSRRRRTFECYVSTTASCGLSPTNGIVMASHLSPVVSNIMSHGVGVWLGSSTPNPLSRRSFHRSPLTGRPIQR